MRRPALILTAVLAATPASATPFDDATRWLAARPMTLFDWLAINGRTDMEKTLVLPGQSSQAFRILTSSMRFERTAQAATFAEVTVEVDKALLGIGVEWKASPTSAECVALLEAVRDTLLSNASRGGRPDPRTESGRRALAASLMGNYATPPSRRLPDTPNDLGAGLAARTWVVVTLMSFESGFIICSGSLAGTDYRDGLPLSSPHIRGRTVSAYGDTELHTTRRFVGVITAYGRQRGRWCAITSARSSALRGLCWPMAASPMTT